MIKPGSPALQADSLPSEPPGKPLRDEKKSCNGQLSDTATPYLKTHLGDLHPDCCGPAPWPLFVISRTPSGFEFLFLRSSHFPPSLMVEWLFGILLASCIPGRSFLSVLFFSFLTLFLTFLPTSFSNMQDQSKPASSLSLFL